MRHPNPELPSVGGKKTLDSLAPIDLGRSFLTMVISCFSVQYFEDVTSAPR